MTFAYCRVCRGQIRFVPPLLAVEACLGCLFEAYTLNGKQLRDKMRGFSSFTGRAGAWPATGEA
ncbi:MAG: hypothetical protein IH851_04125 [Armatimonadetes bacterium]|nr:hypothetical protein [Armatimonadota bacterium]